MEKMEIGKELIRKLVDGTIGDQDVLRLQNAVKDDDRFQKYIEVLQERVSWEDTIIMRLSDNVYVVKKEKADEIVTKCTCGHEFGDYRINWKLNCLINVRRTLAEMGEVYSPEPACPEPDWQEIREFICPTCAAQLAVEVVPPGYPVIMEFLPDIPGFYREYLGKPLASEGKYECSDKSLELTDAWGREA